MKIAYTIWTWMKEEFRSADTSEATVQKFEQAMREISYLGYDSVENFNFTVDVFGDRPEAFRSMLEQYKLEFVNIYHYLEQGHEKDIAKAEHCCKFMQQHGISMMNIQAPKRPENGVVSTETLQEICHTLTQMAKTCLKYGVTLCLHPHQNTCCETREELEYILTHVDENLLKLCIDTCHIVFGGMDPVKIVSLYGKRIAYVHLKDVIADWKPPYDGPATKKARALGEGIIDFPGIHKALLEHGYDGVLCVEVDFPAICNFDTAQKSRTYIRSVLGY